MEYLAAYLTAASYWIFVLYGLGAVNRELRSRAGRRLLVLRRPWGPREYVNLLLTLLSAAAILLVIVPDSVSQPWSLPTALVAIAIVTFVTAALMQQLWVSVELRERGIIETSSYRPLVIGWYHIRRCIWISDPPSLLVQGRWSPLYFRVSPAKMREATAVLVRYVEVEDATDTIPDEELMHHVEMPDHVAEPPPAHTGCFQFTVATFLLLMLAASSTFSWISIRERRDLREEGKEPETESSARFILEPGAMLHACVDMSRTFRAFSGCHVPRLRGHAVRTLPLSSPFAQRPAPSACMKSPARLNCNHGTYSSQNVQTPRHPRPRTLPDVFLFPTSTAIQSRANMPLDARCSRTWKNPRQVRFVGIRHNAGTRACGSSAARRCHHLPDPQHSEAIGIKESTPLASRERAGLSLSAGSDNAQRSAQASLLATGRRLRQKLAKLGGCFREDRIHSRQPGPPWAG